MKKRVVDASLVAAFLLREPSGERFDPLVQSAADMRLELHVPSLFTFEILNIIAMAERRGRITAMDRDRLLSEWASIPLHEDGADADTPRNILLLAREFRLTAYDAAYVELAIRLDAGLSSLDGDLLKLKPVFDWIE